MSESRLVWAPIKRQFDARGWHSTRIENSTMPGTPDVNVYIPPFDVWLELKFVRNIQEKIGLRKEQFLWLRQAKNSGRFCYVVARLMDQPENLYIWDKVEDWERLKSEPVSNLLDKSKITRIKMFADILMELSI